MKRKATLNCVLLLTLAAAGGCSSPQFRRIDADREVYESWPIETRQAVLDGHVEKGMTPDMVRMAIGKPTEIVSGSTAPGEEIWIYRTGGYEDTSAMSSPYPYPGGGYPGGSYPGGGMGGPMIGVGGPSIGVSTGRGGTSIGTSMGTGIGIGTGVGPVGIGIGGGGMGTGVMSPMPMPAAPTVEREVVFRDGVVFRADNPETK